MVTNKKLLGVLLTLAMLLGSALLTDSSVKAEPLHQEEAETPSIPDASAKIFLPFVSVDGSPGDAELETELQASSTEATSQTTRLCNLLTPGPIYSRIDFVTGHVSGYLYTAAKGRGFRAYSELFAYGTLKGYFYGYSAQDPTKKGWVQDIHLYNCQWS